MSNDRKKAMMDYLHAMHHMTIATVNHQNSPNAATVSHVATNGAIYFMTDRRTRKVNNILSNPRVAITVDTQYKDWMKIQGIQLEGNASVVDDPQETQNIMQAFLQKFPQASQLPPDYEMVLIKVIPDWSLFIDNTIEFGHREEIHF